MSQHRSSLLSSAVLGSLVAFGIFNRITFPAFLLPAGIYLLPHFSRKPFSLLILCSTFLITCSTAIAVDTSFYNPSADSLFHLLRTKPIITPLNSILYNSSASNLSMHGLHPIYQHLVSSLPQLLGPALLLLWYMPRLTLPILSSFSATVLLSWFPHQEPRFLLPAVPLVLSAVCLPRSTVMKRLWVVSWVIFNLVLAMVMGVYHQGGIISAQLWLGQQVNSDLGLNEVFWWRTYSPPVWLLGGKEMLTTDLMGMTSEDMMARISGAIGGCGERRPRIVGLVAPLSSVDLEHWIEASHSRGHFSFDRVWKTKQHLNLDDIDFDQDGIRGSIARVVGRRGLVIWKISRLCGSSGNRDARQQ